jgi:anti-anti-sigma factor
MAEKPTSRSLRSTPPARRPPTAAVLALRPAPGSARHAERWEETVATVAVRGDLDREALWAIDYTISRASIEAGRIVLDLRDVTHLDYQGVPELVTRRAELRSRGGDLLIAVRNPYVTNILRAAGGPDLSLFRSVEEASAGGDVVTAGASRRAASSKKGT